METTRLDGFSPKTRPRTVSGPPPRGASGRCRGRGRLGSFRAPRHTLLGSHGHTDSTLHFVKDGQPLFASIPPQQTHSSPIPPQHRIRQLRSLDRGQRGVPTAPSSFLSPSLSIAAWFPRSLRSLAAVLMVAAPPLLARVLPSSAASPSCPGRPDGHLPIRRHFAPIWRSPVPAHGAHHPIGSSASPLSTERR